MSVCLGVGMCTCEYSWPYPEGLGSPQAGVTGGSQLPDMGAGTKLRSTARLVRAFNPQKFST